MFPKIVMVPLIVAIQMDMNETHKPKGLASDGEWYRYFLFCIKYLF